MKTALLLSLLLTVPVLAQAPAEKAPAVATTAPVDEVVAAYLGWWRAASLRQQEALTRVQATKEYADFDVAQKARAALEADLGAKLAKLGKHANWQTGEVK